MIKHFIRIVSLTVVSFAAIGLRAEPVVDNDAEPNEQKGLIVYGGVAGGYLMHRSFSQFADAYNAYYGAGLNQLDKDLGKFGWQSGYRFGVTLFTKVNVGFTMSYDQLLSSASAELIDKSKRRFRHVVRTPALGVDLQRLGFRFGYRIGIAANVIESSYEYPDGTVSYGRERLLNGIYSSTSIYQGLEIAKNVELFSGLSLEAGITLNAFFRGYYDDGHHGKNGVYVNNYGFVYPDRLPLDFEALNSGPWSNYNQNNTVKSSGVYANLFIVLKYQLWNKQ